ncbi:tetratricopeptide repeat protein [Streptomyces sp. NPDC029216]|uniref:tetratricopeptide repeat protein n=1 Tax=Streptomyces sp. NPDC029216 TaxID=3154701 RepID=UPI0033FB6E66
MGWQWARAEGNSRITQVGGDLHVHLPAGGLGPQAPRGLPDGPAELVGRREPAAGLMEVLAPGGPAVAVVHGMPGVGKSALAVTVAQRALEAGWFEGGVLYVTLRGYDPAGPVDAGGAVAALLVQLGVRQEDLPPTREGRLALYRSELAARAGGGRRVLVVADDAAEVGQVRDLVPAGGGHRLLVTSRHRLVAPGFEARLLPLDELAVEAARELLAGALLRVRPDDPRPGREPGALAEVAERCGRLPLALTVAGALLADDPGTAVAELARRLADARTRLEALSFSDGAGLSVGVRAALDLSYARLPADQARLLRLLTVDPGVDWPLVNAAVLAHAGGPPVVVDEELLDTARGLLAGLVRAGLLVEEHPGALRWRVHDLVRLHATEQGERLAAEDDREAATDRLLNALVTLLSDADVVLRARSEADRFTVFPDVPTAMAWLDAECEHLIAAARLAAATGRAGESIAFARGLTEYLERRHRFADALELHRSALAEARRVGNPEAEMMLTCGIGSALMETWRVAEALELLEPAVAAYAERGEDPRLLALGCDLLAAALRTADRFDEALELNERALEIARALEDGQMEGQALSSAARTLFRAGRAEEAIGALQRAAVLLDAAGDAHGVARVTDNLGNYLSQLGRHQEAIDAHDRGLNLYLQARDPVGVAGALHLLGNALMDAGSVPQSILAQQDAAARYIELGDTYGEGLALLNMGAAQGGLGRYREAVETLTRASELLARHDDPAMATRAVFLLGVTLAMWGRFADAEPLLADAVARMAAEGDPERQAEVEYVLAQVRAKLARRGPLARLRGRFGRTGGGRP